MRWSIINMAKGALARGRAVGSAPLQAGAARHLAVMFALAAALAGDPEWPPPDISRDDILFVGMNPSGADEAMALRQTGAEVTLIQNAREADRVRADADGNEYDLATEQGALGFVETFGLPADQTRHIAAAITATTPGARDEIGRIAEIWARAERGKGIPPRLVLSGHGAGAGVWGTGNGGLSFAVLGALAEAMPRAASSVEDLLAAGCYTGNQYTVLELVAMFPGIKMIWGYWGSAPTAYQGAMSDMTLWERATRGPREDVDGATVARIQTKGLIALWTRARGYDDGRRPRSLDDARATLEARTPVYERCFRGERAGIDEKGSGESALRGYYIALQEVLAYPELPSEERTPLERRRDQALRLLYYRIAVAPRFAAVYAKAIHAGFSAMEMRPPDFATLGRREALKAIEGFGARVRGASPPPPEAEALLPLLEDGLRDLSPTLILENWI